MWFCFGDVAVRVVLYNSYCSNSRALRGLWHCAYIPDNCLSMKSDTADDRTGVVGKKRKKKNSKETDASHLHKISPGHAKINI